MDRLIYTDRKTSGKKIKFNIGKKKFEISLELERILSWVKIFVIGAIMGTGSFMVLYTTFGLSYSGGPFSGGIKGGLIKVYNDIAYKLADECGIFINQLSGASEHCGLFLTIILLVLVAFAILMVISKNKWLAFVYVIFAIVPLVGWDLSGSVPSYVLLALGVGLFLAEGTQKKNNYGGMIYIAVVAAVAFAIISLPVVSHLADKPQAMQNYTEKTRDSVIEKYYGTNPLKDGYLRDAKREKGSGIALQVTMTDPHSMYLRGFVGDILENDGWVPNSNTVYYDSRNLMYWLKDSGFNGLGQLQQSTAIANKGGKKKLNTAYHQKKGDVTVHNVNANSKYAYIPYEITKAGIKDTDGGKIDNQNWGNSFITGGWRTKLKAYSFTSAGNLTPEWTETAAKFYSNNATPDEQENYELCESHYNSYVYSNYLYISPEDLAILNEKIGNKGIQKRGHVEYNTAVNNVRQIMNGLFTYTEKIKFKENKSAFANIMTNYQGYDVHYATVAVMMFRYYGIPARYVEGYMITPDDVARGSDTFYVKERKNHAWPEIYVDGIGFVPVEVCPNYMGMMEDADYTIGISNKTKQNTLDQSQQNTENPNGTGTSDGNDLSKREKIMLIVIEIIIGLILLAAIVLCVIILIKKLRKALARRKLFNKGEPKEASRAIYKRMEELELTPDEEAMDIGNRATYSPHSITEKERQTMLKKLKLFKEKKREQKRSARKKDKPGKDSKAKDNKKKDTKKISLKKADSKKENKKDKPKGLKK